MDGRADHEARGADPVEGPTGAAGWAALVVGALLAILAYRRILRFQPETALEYELEGWFFVPSDTAPPVVVLLAVWLVYRRWDRLRALPRIGGPGALTAGLFLGGIGVFAWSTYTDAPDLLALSLSLNGLGIASLYWGTAGVRTVALPAAFLVFAIPMPGPLLNEVVYRAQIWTAEYSGWLLWMLGIPAFVSGDQVVRTADSFAIIESCSGLRSMETLTMLSVLMVDLFRRRGAHAVVLVVAAPAIAFGMNGFRALALILNPHSDLATVHNAQGILILLGGLLLLYLLDGLLGRVLGGGAVEALPAPPRPRPARGGFSRHLVAPSVLAVCAVVSVLLPPWQAPAAPGPDLQTAISEKIGAWRSEPLEVDKLFLGSARFRDLLHRRYARRRGPAVDVFLGLGDPSLRHKSAFSPKTQFPGSGWVVEHSERRRVGDAGPEVRAQVIRNGSDRRLVLHWYEGNRGPAAETLRALLALDKSPLRREHPALVVRMSTELEGLQETERREAEEVLLGFAEWLRGPLDRIVSANGRRRSSPRRSRRPRGGRRRKGEPDPGREPRSRIGRGAAGRGKSFSRFSGSGKTFSPDPAGSTRGKPTEFNELRPGWGTA